MRKIVKDALNISEMEYAFECIGTDDKKNPDDYTDEEIVNEAEYRLFTYFEDGHANNDDMRLSDDAESRAIARKDIRQLTAFIKRYKTTLSGDLAGDDGPNLENNVENSYSVVTTSNIPELVVGDTVNELDGFTIRGGNADAADTHRGKAYGGGMFCVSEATIIECTFVGNRAVYGGAISCRPSSCCVTEPKLICCTFEGNAAEKEGGAVYIGDSDVYLDRCRIRGNTAAEKGGAVMFGNDNSTTMVNCVIDGNTAGEEGGALFCVPV